MPLLASAGGPFGLRSSARHLPSEDVWHGAAGSHPLHDPVLVRREWLEGGGHGGEPMTAPARAPRGPVTLSTARNVTHGFILLLAIGGMGAGGFFHCVRGGDVQGHGGWTLVPKERWGFHDQFINLDTISTWDISEHRLTVVALVKAGWATVNTAASTDSPPADAPPPPRSRRWCFHTKSDDWCFDRLGDCNAERKDRLATRSAGRPTSKCFKETD